MNPYANEDVMWRRLQDVQREAENRRLYRTRPSLIGLLASLGLSLARSLAASPRHPVGGDPWLDKRSDAPKRVA